VCLGTVTALHPDHGCLVNAVTRQAVNVLAKGQRGTSATNCEVIAYVGRIEWPLQPPQGGQWLKDVRLRSSRANSGLSNGPRRHIAGDGRHCTSPSCRWCCGYSACPFGSGIASLQIHLRCHCLTRSGRPFLWLKPQLCSLIGVLHLTRSPADIERSSASSVAWPGSDSRPELRNDFAVFAS
jgi:hypothetical protein